MLTYNPKKCARLEIRAWQAHHVGKKAALAYYLTRHQMEVFGLGPIVAFRALFFLLPAVRAHNYRKKEDAITHTTKYYEYLKKHVEYSYNPLKVAEQEVDWWWIHDDLEKSENKSQLQEAFAHLYGTIIGIPAELLGEAAAYKVMATIEHDIAETKEIDENKSNNAWKKAEEALVGFYTFMQEAEKRALC